MADASGRILELDGLRALAVLAVISFHYTVNGTLANPVTGMGWIGVDLFFVLSGYLITGILLNARSRPRYFSTFYARRTLRIFPIYYLLLIVYIASAGLWGGRQPLAYWGMHAAFLSSTVEYFHYWNFAAPSFVYAGVTVLWSLSIEEQFYLLWAPVVRWVRPRGLWIILILTMVGAPVLRFLIHNRGFTEYRFFPAHCDGLAAGAALALGWRSWDRAGRGAIRFAWLMAVSGLALAVLIAFTGGGRASHGFATLGYSLLAIFFAALLGWTVLRAGTGAVFCRFLRCSPARYLGRISYAVYLVHYPVFMLVGDAIVPWLGKGPGAAVLRGFVALAAAILVAGASWRYIEAPMLRLKDRWMPAQRLRVELSPAPVRIPN